MSGCAAIPGRGQMCNGFAIANPFGPGYRASSLLPVPGGPAPGPVAMSISPRQGHFENPLQTRAGCASCSRPRTRSARSIGFAAVSLRPTHAPRRVVSSCLRCRPNAGIFVHRFPHYGGLWPDRDGGPRRGRGTDNNNTPAEGGRRGMRVSQARVAPGVHGGIALAMGVDPPLSSCLLGLLLRAAGCNARPVSPANGPRGAPRPVLVLQRPA